MVGVIGGACPNLELRAISDASPSHIQTLRPENLDASTSECPFLVVSVCAGFDRDDRAVSV